MDSKFLSSLYWRLQQSTREGLHVEEVPLQYKEKFINSCYRKPDSTAAECIGSIFTLNNETINVWTHLLPLLLLLVHFYWTFPSELFPPGSIPSDFYPLLTAEVSVCAYLLGSTLAHVFNCMSPRIRHICFYVDYAAISMFGVGGACSTFYYLRPLDTGFFLFDSANLFIGGAAFCNVFTFYVLCASRHKWETVRYIVRTLAFTLPFLYATSPCLLRILKFLFIKESIECPHIIASFLLGYAAYCLAGIFNATRLPERFYPFVFDVFGHNHHWVHIFTTLGTLVHFWAVQVDLEVRKELMPSLLDGVTLWSTFGWMAGTFLLTGTVAVWFSSQLTPDGYLACSLKKR